MQGSTFTLANADSTVMHVRSSWGVKNAPTHANANRTTLSIRRNTDTQICGGVTPDGHAVNSN
jgi:hypothetical protein